MSLRIQKLCSNTRRRAGRDLQMRIMRSRCFTVWGLGVGRLAMGYHIEAAKRSHKQATEDVLKMHGLCEY